ncbi:hypothetical protein H5410_016241 [Solanum commersonii]|uniref:Uncharacterized protein n=1 Tax=Solanum commersonii TaxID=4109 RepID=A0A9J5ZVX2_SOLCO|nr:hypothetical protein H5410_016241 [Solanum commersonii]
MKAEGVIGGSVLGITFFQASGKVESTRFAAGRSVEKGRRHVIVVALVRSLELCRSMIVDGSGGGDRRRLIGNGRAGRCCSGGCAKRFRLFRIKLQAQRRTAKVQE